MGTTEMPRHFDGDTGDPGNPRCFDRDTGGFEMSTPRHRGTRRYDAAVRRHLAAKEKKAVGSHLASTRHLGPSYLDVSTEMLGSGDPSCGDRDTW